MCYGLYDEDKIIGFCAVLHQPHGVTRNLKRCSRLVILPDYQGIGLGTKFLNEVAKMYVQRGWDFRIVTSAKNMIKALNKSTEWKLMRWSANKCSSNKNAIDYKRETMRNDNKTAAFKYESNNMEKENN